MPLDGAYNVVMINVSNGHSLACQLYGQYSRL
jgi:hypothetical protein